MYVRSTQSTPRLIKPLRFEFVRRPGETWADVGRRYAAAKLAWRARLAGP